MNVGYLQTSPVFGKPRENYDQVERILSQYDGPKSIDLLVLPELFPSGYTFVSPEEAESLAEPAEGPTAEFLRSLAAKTGGLVVAGFAERDGSRVYNSSLVVNAEAVVGRYRKIHLFNKETLFFSPGESEPPVYDVGGIKIGVMICFDWFFPETMRILMLKGAQVVAHPSNLVLPYCQDAMKTRCLENRLFAVTANRIGREERGEDNFLFTGASQITALDGRVLSSAPSQEIFIDTASIEPEQAAGKSINPYNDLIENRRTELYGELVDSTNR